MANAKGPVIGGFASLGKKLFITFLLLCVYRVGVYIPVPGTDLIALSQFITTLKGTVFGLFNMFSGGALERLSVLTLGIVPYISASIVMQLLQVLVPSLQRIAKEEGSSGKRKLSQYTRYLTLLLTFVQGYGIAVGLENMKSPGGIPVVLEPGLTFKLVTALTLCAGTMFVMWIGERISEYGIGNGISLIIFAGIVTGLPGALIQLFELYTVDTLNMITVLGLLVFIICVILGVVFFERALRKVPIHYAKRQVGAKVYGGQSTHLPLKLNIAGVIPPIFASSLLLFPATLKTFSNVEILQKISNLFAPNTILYNVVFVILVMFFSYFYTAILFDPKELAENLRKSGAFVPSIRPGEKTEEYFNGVISRLTLWGALYLSVICVLPVVLVEELQLPLYFGGTSLLIVVGVAMDFMSQVESHIISEQYSSLMKNKRNG